MVSVSSTASSVDLSPAARAAAAQSTSPTHRGARSRGPSDDPAIDATARVIGSLDAHRSVTPPVAKRHWQRPAAIGALAGVFAFGMAASAFWAGQQSASAEVATTAQAGHATNAGGSTSEKTSERARAQPGAPESQAPAAAAPVCRNCGVVESVRAVQHKGPGTGVGAVTGGVLGGVLGHQMGGGRGKDAMTVLGAIGGGLAGNEVEKRARAVTTYQVQVRLDNGQARTLEQSRAPGIGTRVRVEGQVLNVLS